MRIFFFFVDGIGLGDDSPNANPFAKADMPTLTQFTNGRAWLSNLPRIEGPLSAFIPTDATLDVPGTPQSATGQAAIMTGRNVPKTINGHYGPKPNAHIGAIIRQASVVKQITARGMRAAMLNAYPTGYLEKIKSGIRLHSANQLAMHAGGVPLRGPEALYHGQAISADFTGQVWRDILGYADAPLITPYEAGQRMARLAKDYHFTLFDHWFTDYTGHRCKMEDGVAELEKLDDVFAGLCSEWDTSEDLIILTSDHGNLEDCQSRRHTLNPVPTLIVGKKSQEFANGLADLTDFASRIMKAFTRAG